MADDPFLLAVIDMQMPGMDGASLGRAIRSDRRLAHTRMVMLTSMGAKEDIQSFQEIGFAAYVNKPIHHDELRDVLALAVSDLPRPQIILPPEPAPQAEGLPEKISPRILLVEDNPTNQQVALGLLENLGLTADVADDGRQAVEAFNACGYDLILMDIQMPVMGGYEATMAIRKYEMEMRKEFGASSQPGSAVIIAMTAGAMEGDKEKSLESGMDDYIAKPVSARALAALIDKWLPIIGKSK